ncbi:uncharacterized protein [Nicotiana tomentosiformis]|uniref:uncharacterized protein n=1 Tax=Nicotiana tomentosiformis TaxID=4098 RepID=UPI00051AB499|nr:ER lumen protein-retaining receptor erd-2.2-like [Nicotiana tomentosiformis]
MGEKELQMPVKKLFLWVRRQSKIVKIFLGVVTSLVLVVILKFFIKKHNHFFVLAEFVHFVGLLCLIYKLSTLKTCSGISLKTQVVTEIFLGVRLFCGYIMSAPIHFFLDLVTLVATIWVIRMMKKSKLKSSYMADLDSMPLWHLIAPCAVVAILIHPHTRHAILTDVLWAFSSYLEAISVLPQLRLMQNVQIIEPFTAHYVFALGIQRFLTCAHWIVQVYDTSGAYLYLAGRGYLWIPMVFISEIVQTFILADFCYYYIKSVISGQLLVRLPTPV